MLDATKLDKGADLPASGSPRNQVALIVYEKAANAGTFGENRLLTIFEGEFQRFELLGSDAAEAALKEFAEFKPKRKQRRKDDDDNSFGDADLGDV